LYLYIIMSELKQALIHTVAYSDWNATISEKDLIERMKNDITNEKTSDYDFEDKKGNNFIDISIQSKKVQLVLELIKTGIFDLGHKNKDGRTALMKACASKLKDVVLALIETGKSKPEAVDNNGFTALMYTCLAKPQDIAKSRDIAIALINTGQSKPEAVNDRGVTALMYACMSKLEDVAKALIKTGNANEKQKMNGTQKDALYFAKQNKLESVVNLLNNDGIDFDDINNSLADHSNDLNVIPDPDDDANKPRPNPFPGNPEFQGGKQKKVRRTRKQKKIRRTIKHKKITKRKNYRKKTSSVKHKKSKKQSK